MLLPENKNLTLINCHDMDWYISYFRYGMGFSLLFSYCMKRLSLWKWQIKLHGSTLLFQR